MGGGVCVCVLPQTWTCFSHTHTFLLEVRNGHISRLLFLQVFSSSLPFSLSFTCTFHFDNTFTWDSEMSTFESATAVSEKVTRIFANGHLQYYPLTLVNYSQLCLCGETFFLPQICSRIVTARGDRKDRGEAVIAAKLELIQTVFILSVFCWPYVESAAQ